LKQNLFAGAIHSFQSYYVKEKSDMLNESAPCKL